MTAALASSSAAAARLLPTAPGLRVYGAIGAGGAAAILAVATLSPRWLAAMGVALAMFYALKAVTLADCWRSARPYRLPGYLLLWPGMNARTFLVGEDPAPERPGFGELAFAGAKLALGIALAVWAATNAFSAPPVVVGWAGMIGAIFVFHFGIFHVLSWGWRRAGIAAPPLMRAPIAARSLAEFWGERWNTAFAELARRFMLRPLARRWGVAAAGAWVFLVSGLVHEVAISLPARGGWGGPTAYFVIQAAGVALEKSVAGRRCGLGRGFRGWAWTLLFTAAPLPLLFHGPLIERVVAPLFRALKEVL